MRPLAPRLVPSAFLIAAALAAACSGSRTEQASPPVAADAGSAGSTLTPFQLEHGIGPITEVVTLGPVNHAMADAGEKLFTSKCSACHKMTERYVGPPLGDVTVRKSAAFIMNQILNPEEMYNKHPEVRKLLGEYMTQMPNLALTQEQARQVVEYLRTQAPAASGS